MSDDARADVLARIRAALGPDPEIPEIPRRYVAAGARAPTGDQALVDRFAQRVADYRADVHRCDEAELPRLLGRLLAGERTVATPDLAAALPRSLDPLGDDPALHHTALDRLDAVLTGCATAIAETGTIVLDGGRDSGRRAISLIPDHHVCVVGADQVVADVPDAIAVLGPAASAGRPLTFISGPSATSDIELERVEGVHGPRRLTVVIVASPEP